MLWLNLKGNLKYVKFITIFAGLLQGKQTFTKPLGSWLQGSSLPEFIIWVLQLQDFVGK